MTQPKRCTLTWCQAPHDDDTDRIAHHYQEIGEYRAGQATVNVVARWAERIDGRPSIDPHVSIFTNTPDDDHVIDLTPREARIWAGQLKVLDGSPWLAGQLTSGADMLHEWEVDEFGGMPHRVTDVPRNTPAAYFFALKAAADAARLTLEAFERMPVAALNAMELMRWVGEYRGIVRSMVETIDAVTEAGVPA